MIVLLYFMHAKWINTVLIKKSYNYVVSICELQKLSVVSESIASTTMLCNLYKSLQKSPDIDTPAAFI